MKKHITLSTLLCALGCAAGNTVSSPDGRLVVTVDINGAGSPTYVVTYDGNTMLEPSPLGLVTDLADYTKGLSIKDVKESKIDKVYHQDRIKSSNNRYVANEARYTMADAKATGPAWSRKRQRALISPRSRPLSSRRSQRL